MSSTSNESYFAGDRPYSYDNVKSFACITQQKILFWKKSILEGRDLGKNACKIWKTFCEYQIHGFQKDAILWVLKHDFGAHKKLVTFFNIYLWIR